jgi:predicted transcriptional regulator
MADSKILSFVGNKQIEAQLKRWAAADDRSVSYVIRQIVNREVERRERENRQAVKTA